MRLTRILSKVKSEEFRYWHRFVERQRRKYMGLEVHNHQTGYKTVQKKRWYYDEHRPWTVEAATANRERTRVPDILIEPVKKQKLFKGDIVEVLVGKDKGKKGVIKKIVYERNWCFVEGLHLKFERSQIPDLIVRQEKPLLTTSEVALVDPSDSKSTEVEWRFLEDGTQVRVSKRSGRIIPFPPEAENLWEDFVDVSKYRASKTKDTAPKDLQEVTYKPKLCTFEEDILEQHGIKEDKKFQKKFWY